MIVGMEATEPQNGEMEDALHQLQKGRETCLQKLLFAISMETSQPDLVRPERGQHLPMHFNYRHNIP